MNSDISTFAPDSQERKLETPAERRREKVRQTILEAAERVFAEEGYEGLSIRRLADEIDYSPYAIYKYFASKTELVGCLKEAFFMRLVRNIETAIGDEPSSWVFVKDCTKAYVRTAMEKPHHYVAAFTPTSSPVDDCADESELMQDESTPSAVAFRFLCDGLRDGVAQGVFRPDLDCHMAAISIAMSMHGIAKALIHQPAVFMTRADGSQMTVEEVLEFSADQLVRGIQNPAKMQA